MTLFVDCNNSEYALVELGNAKEKNLFKRDNEAMIDNFKNSSALSIVFKDLPEIGTGFMIFKAAEDSSKTLVHIRCTSQTSNSQCLVMKRAVSLSGFLLEGTKSKAKRIFEALGVKVDSKSLLKSISTRKLKKRIQQMDSDLSLNRFKFGIAYLDRFDTSEQQMLSNTIEDSCESEYFSQLIQGLGSQINLRGWKGFAGGLDVSEEVLTGDKAIYKKYSKESVEVIYHVAPWLPLSNYDDESNLERKRHFGNDTIVMIYSESLYAFEMQTLLSRQIQVVLFVRFITRLRKYQIYVYSKIPNLVLESNPLYFESNEHDFEKLSQLLMGLERQCYETKPLLDKVYSMRNFHLTRTVNKFM